LIGKKGPLRLIEAFEEVARRFPDAVLVIAGDGRLLEECRTSAAKCNAQVHVLGHVDDVGALYADGDVFVSPSTAESFGISAMEAALSDIPMILGRIAPWTDVFTDGEHCEFVDPESIPQIESAIVRLLDDPTRARRQAKQAKSLVVEKYSEQAALEAMTAAYSAAMAKLRRT